MNKIIVRNACIAFAGACLGALIVFSMWILCAPQTMATASEKVGNYSFAVTCADLRFKYTKKTADLARCAEDGILSRKDKHILNYCGKLIARADFDGLCAAKDAKQTAGYGYKSYICGNLAAAQYRGGNLDKAVETASAAGSQSFIKLVIEVVEKGTKPQAEKLKTALLNSNFNDTNSQNLIKILDQFLSTGE